MARKTIVENWRVEVTPETPSKNSHNLPLAWYKACVKLKADINRTHPGAVTDITNDHSYVCEYCGADWDALRRMRNRKPICCQKAGDEWVERQTRKRKKVKS